MSKVEISNILRLPISDRISAAQEIWESVAADSEAVPVPPEQRRELERRLAEHERESDATVEWDQVEKKIRAMLER